MKRVILSMIVGVYAFSALGMNYCSSLEGKKIELTSVENKLFSAKISVEENIVEVLAVKLIESSLPIYTRTGEILGGSTYKYIAYNQEGKEYELVKSIETRDSSGGGTCRAKICPTRTIKIVKLKLTSENGEDEYFNCF